MEMLDEKTLSKTSGGAGLMNEKLPKLKKDFENACKHKNFNKMMSILPELQARGAYGWAKETANRYGINSI
jgi:hypothetical protein